MFSLIKLYFTALGPYTKHITSVNPYLYKHDPSTE